MSSRSRSDTITLDAEALSLTRLGSSTPSIARPSPRMIDFGPADGA